MKQYEEYIMRNVRENLGLEPDDTTEDEAIMEMSKKEVLERYFVWQGIIGYENDIINSVQDIFEVDLGVEEEY